VLCRPYTPPFATRPPPISSARRAPPTYVGPVVYLFAAAAQELACRNPKRILYDDLAADSPQKLYRCTPLGPLYKTQKRFVDPTNLVATLMWGRKWIELFWMNEISNWKTNCSGRIRASNNSTYIFLRIFWNFWVLTFDFELWMDLELDLRCIHLGKRKEWRNERTANEKERS
jgi:hypothetical protein